MKYKECKDVNKTCDSVNKNNCHLCRFCLWESDDKLYCVKHKKEEGK